MEQKKAIGYQLDMFIEHKRNLILHSEGCEDVHQATAGLDLQVNGKKRQGRALAGTLMRAVCAGDNIKRAYKQVKKNKGAAGIDQLPVGAFSKWYAKEGQSLTEHLLLGTYQPQPVREVKIPKPNGGERKLGIPTVIDRVIQQAISQVLTPIYEPTFSENSYGFRPRRNAHQALKKMEEHYSQGYMITVDLDLANFFDEVNHDRLMYHLSRKVCDKALLGLIRRYLRSGILAGGIISARTTGTPQGSPLSPLLSNIVLDELDKELEKRGHKFVRYADDCNIFVRSLTAGERVKQSVSNFIKKKLKLRVNQEKSKVCKGDQANFLGYSIHKGKLSIAEKSRTRLKDKVRAITKRNRGRKLSQIISELNSLLRGWLQYFREAKNCQRVLGQIDSWIMRKVRCYRLKQLKRIKTAVDFLTSLGVDNRNSWRFGCSYRGYWYKSDMPQAQWAMNSKWFEKQNLYNLAINYQKLNN